jgi:squalene-associated FAD-dependent desaturase
MAGIAAAVTLAERGARPILIESRPYIGGRTRSFIHAGSGDEIDNGQHLMMGCYRSTFALLEKLGTRDLVAVDRSLGVEFREPGGRRVSLNAPRILPSPLDVLAGMLAMKGIGIGERLALLRLGASVATRRPGSDETVAGYLARLGQSRRLRDRLWDPLAIATLNTPPEKASALLFVEVMRRAFLGRGDDSHLAFPTVGLSRLVDPARDHIERHGGTVITGAPVAAIERRDDAWLIRLKDGDPIIASKVISALPERALRRVIPLRSPLASILPPASSFGYSPIVSLYLWYDIPLPLLPRFAALIGTSVQWVFNRGRIAGERDAARGGLLSCTISAAFEESASESGNVAAMAGRELASAFPEMRGARLVDALVIKEKHATFAATPEAERHRPSPRIAHDGFLLAGDWTATGLPATIEGAVMSGVAAGSGLYRR